MGIRVVAATAGDLSAIHAAYDAGRVVQRAQSTTSWPEFSDARILSEIDNQLLFCVVDGDAIAGVFSIAYEDQLLWGDLERGAHIYLHRISRAANYDGHGIVHAVIAWARAKCVELGREGLRVDTWASNAALVAYYERFGFQLLGTRVMSSDPRLSVHYHGIELALMEERVGEHYGNTAM
ncbi:MAG: GNAT family N-acetyltransferase [Gemmatimonadaceae bacterium]